MKSPIYGRHLHGFDRHGAMAQRGALSENEVRRWLEARPDVANIADVRSQPSWFGVDVDFIVRLATGQKLLVEVKGDALMHRSGNIVFEVLRLYPAARRPIELAWSGHSAADRLYYHDQVRHRVYDMALRDYQSRAARYVHRQADAGQRPTVFVCDTNKRTTTLGIAIPIAEFDGIYTVHNTLQCPACEGEGGFAGTFDAEPCPMCGGSGQLNEEVV